MTKEQKLCDYLMAKHVGQDKAIHSKKLEKRAHMSTICAKQVYPYVAMIPVIGLPRTPGKLTRPLSVLTTSLVKLTARVRGWLLQLYRCTA